MTLSELQLWRKKIPFLLAIVCALPWLLVRPDAFSQAQIPSAVLILAFGLAVGFFYVTLKLRETSWKRENREYVGRQIQNSLVELIPQDLDITPAEREELADTEIYKELTGVFWEAIDQSDVLRAHKEHFYSNGLEYSSAIDVDLLFRFFGLCYLAASLTIGGLSLFVIGVLLVLVAMIARWLAIPRIRQEHLRLSTEQLNLLRREKLEFIEDRFRQIVLGWRSTLVTRSPVIESQRIRPHALAVGDVALVLLVILLAVIGALRRGWFGTGPEVKGPAEVNSAYVTDGQHDRAVVVVFVHGIFGTKDDTWLLPGAGNSFPQLLAADPELKDKVDVFAFEYFTPKFGSAPSIVDLADQLRGELEDHQVFQKHQQVVFLAHSMGGIIVRQLLLAHQDRINKVPMAFFYATPTNGSELASLAKLASSSPQLRGMAPIEGNDFLQSIQSMWLNSEKARSIASYCGVEELPTFGVMVVTRSSATSLCNRGLDPFSTDHMNIVKPSSRADPRYARFVSALRQESLVGESQAPNIGVPTRPIPTTKKTQRSQSDSKAEAPPTPVTSSPFDTAVAKWRIEHDPYALTLHDLFLTDFDSVQQREMGAIFVDDAHKISVQYSIDVELTARSKFLIFYVPANEQQTPGICAYLAKQFQFVLDNAPAQLLVNQKGVGDSGIISTKEAVFTKRIYVYHETFLDAETTVGLTKLFEQQGASVILRSLDYASTKRMEYRIQQQSKAKR